MKKTFSRDDVVGLCCPCAKMWKRERGPEMQNFSGCDKENHPRRKIEIVHTCGRQKKPPKHKSWHKVENPRSSFQVTSFCQGRFPTPARGSANVLPNSFPQNLHESI